MTLLQRFQNLITARRLVEPGEKVLVAVSGGIDSVTLLDLFVRSREELKLHLGVVHVNHGLRGRESDDDEVFVRSLAEGHDLPIYVSRLDPQEYVRLKGLSLEGAARRLRYGAFQEVLQSEGYDRLATAHTANDQAETVLDHLLRGSGVRGLAGIPLIRDRTIRPLLPFTRKEIETYAADHQLAYRLDSSNLSPRFRRNRIRRELIPLLEERFNAAVVPTLAKTAVILREVEEYLQAEGKRAFDQCVKAHEKEKIVLDLQCFLGYFNITKKYVLLYAAQSAAGGGLRLNTDVLERILHIAEGQASGKTVPLGLGWEAKISGTNLVILRRPPVPFELSIEIGRSYELFEGQAVFKSDLQPVGQKVEAFPEDPNLALVDYDSLTLPLVVRTPRAGDRFRPLNLGGTKKLSDFFIDEKVPNHWRPYVPVVVCPKGIVWVSGYRLDDRFKVTDETKQMLRLELRWRKRKPDRF